MNEIEAIKKIMKSKKISGATLAEKLGYKTASAVTNRLQSKTMTVEILVNLLDALDCELIISDKTDNQATYTVTNDNRNEVKIYKSKQ